MSESSLPEELHAFLVEHIASLEDLEVLLTLLSGGERWCDARTVGLQVGLSEAQARHVLDRFVAQNLLDIRVTETVRYQLSPGTPAIAEAVRLLGECHRRDPRALLRWTATLKRRSITDFADAFRLRRR